jgi:hypothetical protein
MNKYELILHLRELDFREINQLFAKLLGLANGIHEEIYSQHPIYLPFEKTYARFPGISWWANKN